MKYSNLYSKDSKVLNFLNSLVLSIVIGYYVGLGILSIFHEFRTFNFVQLCLGQPAGETQNIMLFSVMVPNMVIIGITIALDFATKVKINQVVATIDAELQSVKADKKRRDEIAKRAIYINVGLFLPWILYSGKYFLLINFVFCFCVIFKLSYLQL